MRGKEGEGRRGRAEKTEGEQGARSGATSARPAIAGVTFDDESQAHQSDSGPEKISIKRSIYTTMFMRSLLIF